MKKYGVVFALFLLSMITYIDRVCISAAKDPIAREMGLSDNGMGLVFGAFALGYGIAQIPAGWFADVAGPRTSLGSVATVWSALTALTAATWNLSSLWTVRLLFGVGEAGAFPGSARAICNWLPKGERGRACGVLFSGSRLGAALSFPLLAWMLARWHWRTSFLILGGIGTVWAVCWVTWFHDHPAEGPRVKPAAAPDTADFSNLLRSRAMLLAIVQYFASNFTFFLCLSWMLPWLKSQYTLGDAQAAAWAMPPLLMGAMSQWIAGWLVDRIYRSPLRAWSRRLPAICGFMIAAIGFLSVTRATTAATAVACFTLAVFGSDMTVSPSWVFCTDVAGKNAGGVSGAMNMSGSLGSFASASAFPWLKALTGSAQAYFLVAAMLDVLAVCCWLGMRSIEPLVPGSALPGTAREDRL